MREIGAPDVVVESVDRRLMRPERGPGTRTHDLRGRELAERKRRSKERLREERLRVYEALQRTGFAPKDIRESTGMGRETVRKALYGGVGPQSARGDRYGPRKGRSEEEMRALEEELRRPPKRNCKKLGRWCLNPSDLGNT